MIESDYERSPETKRQPAPSESSVSLRRTDRLISRAKFSEADQRKLEETSHEKLLDQIQSSTPDEVTIPSRLLRND